LNLQGNLPGAVAPGAISVFWWETGSSTLWVGGISSFVYKEPHPCWSQLL